MKNFLYCVATVVLLAGCSKELDLKDIENKGADEIFALAKSSMESGKYDDAVQIFTEFCKLYPYSKLCCEAELLSGDCKHKRKKYDEATAYYESFIKAHPMNEKVPYALYMLASINFEQMPIIERCQEPTVKALSYFSELCERFPDSGYVKDAKEKIILLNRQLAGREVYVARHYQSRKNYAAAICRLNTVIDSYRSTIHVPESLHRLVECYVAMGLVDEAIRPYGILKREFPQTSWARHSESLLTGVGALGKSAMKPVTTDRK
jgi:outer membrane protein assembly factor BamD